MKLHELLAEVKMPKMLGIDMNEFPFEKYWAEGDDYRWETSSVIFDDAGAAIEFLMTTPRKKRHSIAPVVAPFLPAPIVTLGYDASGQGQYDETYVVAAFMYNHKSHNSDSLPDDFSLVYGDSKKKLVNKVYARNSRRDLLTICQQYENKITALGYKPEYYTLTYTP